MFLPDLESYIFMNTYANSINFHVPVTTNYTASVKHLKNSQQIDYTTDHGNSYADKSEKLSKYF
jgi:hypothetical protein